MKEKSLTILAFFYSIGVLLIILKTLKLIYASWWWILAPFYMPLMAFIIVMVALFIIYTIRTEINNKLNN